MATVQVLEADQLTAAADASVGLVFEDQTFDTTISSLDKALNGAISDLHQRGEIKGKLHELTVINTLGQLPFRWLMLLGAGKRSEATPDRLGRVYGQAARHADSKGWQVVTASIATPVAEFSVREYARAAAVDAVAAPLRLDFYKTRREDKNSKPPLDKLLFCETDPTRAAEIRAGVSEGTAIGGGVNLARSLVIRPANEVTPKALAEEARRTAESCGIEFYCLGPKEMEELGMGCLLAVARGSANEPRLAVMRYGSFEGAPTIAFIGKGLTFDSGGISLKPRDGLENLKQDMAGAAAVIGAMYAIAHVKPRINVIGVCACAENLPDGNAVRPGDILRSMSGKTVECINTDAEGRLVLADAITYAQQKEGAKYIVDLATLTGACVVALGHTVTGVMGAPQEFVELVIKNARAEGEKAWQLPMYEEHSEQLKSTLADIKNVGGRSAGAITGACFLKEFVQNGTSWAHLDIAGTAELEDDKPYMPKGPTGVGVRTLVRLAKSMQLQREGEHST